MSGISGIWNLDGKPLSRELLERVAQCLQHRGPDGTASWQKGSVGLSSSLLRVTPESKDEVQPVVHSSGCVLVFDGRLDNRSELIEELRESHIADAATPDSLLALLAYLQWGQTFPARMIGDFALALFDPRSRELLLARDVVGIRPIYFYGDEKVFLFGSEIKAILAHPDVKTKPNEGYLAVTMVGGTPPGDQSPTHFENILSLPPSHVLVVGAGKMSRKKYWEFDLSKQIRYTSSDEYVEAFRHSFQQAVRRRLRSAFPVAITVSGGLDSSSIFCVAQKLKMEGELPCPDIVGITQISEPGTPSDEQVFIRVIERDYGLAIERLPLEFRPLLEGIRSSVLGFEAPVGDLHWYNNLVLLRSAKDHGARSLLTGHWGDQVLFHQSYLIDLFRCLKWGRVKAHLAEYCKWVDAQPQWFKNNFRRDLIKHHIPGPLRPLLVKIRSYIRAPSKDQPWFEAGFRRLAARSMSTYHPSSETFASVHSRGMYEEMRAKYHIQAMEWSNKSAAAFGVDRETPFLDRDLLAFLMSIPGEFVTDQGVHRGLLRRGMKQVLPVEIVDRRTKADFSVMENEMMTLQFDDACKFFDDATEIYRRNYIDREALKKELGFLRHKMVGNTCQLAWAMTDLVALEAWLKEFLVAA